MMNGYEYVVRPVKRNIDELRDELERMGKGGWEVVTILEQSWPGAARPEKERGWLIVSKKAMK